MPESSTRPGRARTALAVVGAAALLVTGLDAVTYAATGQSVILGKTNTANKATTIKNTGNGPALKLKNKKKSKPPLVVNSKTLVKKLNADLLDGKSLEEITPTRYRMSVGTDNATNLSGGQYVVTTALPAGTYEMTMDGFVGGADPVQCLAIDYTKLVAGDASGYFIYEINEGSSSGIAVQGVAVAPVIAGNQVLFGCDFGTSTNTGRAPQLILERIDAPGATPGTAPFVPRGAGARALDNPAIR